MTIGMRPRHIQSMTNRRKRPRDISQRAKTIVGIATGELEDKVPDDGKDKAAQELGRKGGKARAENMTPERRTEIAKKAALARWKK